MKTLSDDGSILDEEVSQRILASHIRHWEQYDFGVWLFEQLSDRDVIGYCGLRKCRILDQQEIELFFGIRSLHFRNGFGTEMARAVVSKGFFELNLGRIVGFTLEDNSASRALMTKIGMVHVDVVEHAGLPHCLYRIDKDQG